MYCHVRKKNTTSNKQEKWLHLTKLTPVSVSDALITSVYYMVTGMKQINMISCVSQVL